MTNYSPFLFSKIVSDRICSQNLLQYDAFDIGFITTDDFTNADILEATYPAIAKRLHGDWTTDPAIPVVTGFLGKVCRPRFYSLIRCLATVVVMLLKDSIFQL